MITEMIDQLPVPRIHIDVLDLLELYKRPYAKKPVLPRNKVNRNAICPCGCGRKAKKCHENQPAHRDQ